jgi:pimeloyl-ACP methyl ester carboxylesterase
VRKILSLDNVLAVAGSVGGVLLLRAWAKARDERDLSEIRRLVMEASAAQLANERKLASALPPRVSPPVPGPAPLPLPPRQINEATLTPQAGRLYHVTVDVNFPASLAANASDVKHQAEKNGFENVNVSKTKPVGWPGSTSGDYYVTATYAGGPLVMERSHGGGQVKIKDVWEG